MNPILEDEELELQTKQRSSVSSAPKVVINELSRRYFANQPHSQVLT
jgi:hypothetical protein